MQARGFRGNHYRLFGVVEVDVLIFHNLANAKRGGKVGDTKNIGSASLGMDGTWVIHPQQAQIANECYTPNESQVNYARRVLGLYHEKGGGSMPDPETGEMIDEATIKIALMDLAKAVQAGTVEASYLTEQAAKSKSITGYDILEQMKRIG